MLASNRALLCSGTELNRRKPYRPTGECNMRKWPDGKTVALGLVVPWERWPEDLGTSRSHQRSNKRPLPADARYDRDMSVIFDHLYGERQGCLLYTSDAADDLTRV